MAWLAAARRASRSSWDTAREPFVCEERLGAGLGVPQGAEVAPGAAKPAGLAGPACSPLAWRRLPLLPGCRMRARRCGGTAAAHSWPGPARPHACIHHKSAAGIAPHLDRSTQQPSSEPSCRGHMHGRVPYRVVAAGQRVQLRADSSSWRAEQAAQSLRRLQQREALCEESAVMQLPMSLPRAHAAAPCPVRLQAAHPRMRVPAPGSQHRALPYWAMTKHCQQGMHLFVRGGPGLSSLLADAWLLGCHA